MKITHRIDKNIKRSRSYWDSITASDWANTNPPWRPSAKEQKIIEKLIKSSHGKNPNYKIALLGATPEIRSILAKQHLSVDVIDYSANVYATAGQISQVNPKENYHEKGWIDFFKQSKTEKYDLILGDLILRLLTNNATLTLSKYVARALKKNGLLVLRVHISKKHVQVLPPFSKLIEQLQKNGLEEEEITDSLFFPISEYFIKRSCEVDLKKLRQAVNEYRLQKISKGRKQILQAFVNKWTHVPLTFYMRTKFDIDKLLAPFFKNIRIYPGQYNNLINIHIVIWQKLKV